ncbi:Polyphenol oxidase [Commensalibacter sp. Nvir]|uniref:peptidoglycan editing factor PgeF n=1 Tax=Commensalibacter sp. Nvir TaxID=3069817 RepID=UPI002D438B2E|nr:Polyphenol oxidase [Commensalibacter sp. Nvir]
MSISNGVIRHPLLSNTVRHGFFTRLGGVSKGEYASLNCGLKTDDNFNCIKENRKRVARVMHVDPLFLWGGLQIHSTKVLCITKENNVLQEADGAVTNDPNIAVSVVTADCAPVLFSSFDGKIVGAAHAGWKGAAFGILEELITKMEELGAKTREITAIVGPCIDGNRYEVKEDMRRQVLEQDFKSHSFFRQINKEHYLFDLGHYCVDRLSRRRVGIVALLGRDTLSNPKYFFSHRRRTLSGGGALGHQISAIACAEG